MTVYNSFLEEIAKLRGKRLTKWNRRKRLGESLYLQLDVEDSYTKDELSKDEYEKLVNMLFQYRHLYSLLPDESWI